MNLTSLITFNVLVVDAVLGSTVTIKFWQLQRKTNVTMTLEKTKVLNLERSLENGNLASMINLYLLHWNSKLFENDQ